MNLEKFFSDRVTVFRKDIAKDSYGGVSADWEKKYWNVPCRIYSRTNIAYPITFEVSGVERPLTHKMICEAGLDIQIGDKVENSDFSEVYIVVSVSLMRQSRTSHHKEAKLSLTETKAEVTS